MKRKTVLLASLLFLSFSLFVAITIEDARQPESDESLLIENGLKSNESLASVKLTPYLYFKDLVDQKYSNAFLTIERSEFLKALKGKSDLMILFLFLPFPFMLIWSVGNTYLGKIKWLLIILGSLVLMLGFVQFLDLIFEDLPVRLNDSTKIFASIFLVFLVVGLGFVVPQTLRHRNGVRRIASKENNLSFLLSQMNDGFLHARIITDIEGNAIDWKFLDINQKFEKQIGVKRDKVLGKRISQVLPQLNLYNKEWIDRLGNAALNEVPTQKIDYFERYDKWFEISIYCPKRKEFAAIIKDITARVEAETRLKESETRFRNIFEKSKLGIALVNNEGKPFLVNTQLCEIIGYSEEELLMMTFDQFTHPDDIKMDMDLYKGLLDGDIDNYTLNKRYINKKEEVIYARLNVSIIDDPEMKDRYGLAIVEDLTQQYQAELKQKESANKAERLNQILSEVTQLGRIGAWEMDTNRQTCEWSDTVYDIHELKRGKKIGVKDALNFYHHDHKEVIGKAVENGIKEDESWDLELKIVTVHGNERWIRIIGQSVKDQDGNFVKLRGLIQDIHDKKVAELRLKASGEILRRMVDEKTKDLKEINQELESFTYSVSHDLRAPLRAINGFSEAILEDFSQEVPNGVNNYLKRIAKNSKKMGQLIDDLLTFSRMKRKKVKRSSVKANDLIGQIVNEIFYDSKHVIQIDNLPEIYVDEQMMNHVFVNLISNAVKYSSKQKKPQITISSSETESEHVITIEDNGVGFKMEYYDKLFQVFQRLHSESEFEGTGIGLSICDKIMKAHDGEIWADSEEGKGSIFYLKFKKIRESVDYEYA